MVYNEGKGKYYLYMLNVIPVLFIRSVDIRFSHSLQCCFTLYLSFNLLGSLFFSETFFIV